jgi:hypothetical protein
MLWRHRARTGQGLIASSAPSSAELLPRRRATVQTVVVSSYAELRAGPVAVHRFSDRPGDELLAVFRDDMRAIRRVRANVFVPPYHLPRDPSIGEEEIEVTEFRAPGQVAVARLTLLGVDEETVRAALAEQLTQQRAPGSAEPLAWMRDGPEFMSARDRERLDEIDTYLLAETERGDELRASMGVDGWVQMLASSQEEPDVKFDMGIGGRSWLVEELIDWDPRYALRAVLLAYPEADVILAAANIGGAIEQPVTLPSEAMTAVSARAGVNAPVVVLTESKTDAEFLTAGLRVVRPYLTDLIRFLDYEGSPEGGADALASTIQAFAAAGIANRVIAVFGNDTDAADAIRKLDARVLPPQIQIIRYPDLNLGKAYPALGPATPELPDGTLPAANVNGLAGSIELYLGRDVLTRPDGILRPVRWTSYVPSMNRHQGQVDDKAAIHQAFRAKAKAALENPENAERQDWSGLRLIIDAIYAAAQRASGSPDRES